MTTPIYFRPYFRDNLNNIRNIVPDISHKDLTKIIITLWKIKSTATIMV